MELIDQGKLEACIFDLDGVIVDTVEYHFIAWDKLAKELKIPFTKQDNETLKGVSRKRCLDIILELGDLQLDEITKQELLDKKNNLYREYIFRMTPKEVLPGIIEFLDELRESGIRLGLATSSKNGKLILKQVGLSNYFDAMVDGTMITNGKPSPDIFLTCAKLLNVAPNNCIVFEDAVVGIEAAIRGEMRTIGVGSSRILKDADHVISDFEDFSFEKLNSFFSKDII